MQVIKGGSVVRVKTVEEMLADKSAYTHDEDIFFGDDMLPFVLNMRKYCSKTYTVSHVWETASGFKRINLCGTDYFNFNMHMISIEEGDNIEHMHGNWLGFLQD